MTFSYRGGATVSGQPQGDRKVGSLEQPVAGARGSARLPHGQTGALAGSVAIAAAGFGGLSSSTSIPPPRGLEESM